MTCIFCSTWQSLEYLYLLLQHEACNVFYIINIHYYERRLAELGIILNSMDIKQNKKKKRRRRRKRKKNL